MKSINACLTVWHLTNGNRCIFVYRYLKDIFKLSNHFSKYILIKLNVKKLKNKSTFASGCDQTVSFNSTRCVFVCFFFYFYRLHVDSVPLVELLLKFRGTLLFAADQQQVSSAFSSQRSQGPPPASTPTQCCARCWTCWLTPVHLITESFIYWMILRRQTILSGFFTDVIVRSKTCFLHSDAPQFGDKGAAKRCMQLI